MAADLSKTYASAGAALAEDGIPLHFGDQLGEYNAALENAILFDRLHEGRVGVRGRDRFDLLNRLSTNDMLNMQLGEGRPTVLTNEKARILDRVVAYALDDETILVLTEPGRLSQVGKYLQSNIFFRDQVSVQNWGKTHHAFALHGSQADAIVDGVLPGSAQVRPYGLIQGTIDNVNVIAVRTTPLTGSAWMLIVPTESAEAMWHRLLQVGEEHGLRPSGGLVYNALRIRAGWPGVGHELTQSFIPLELGLWDEVSFDKGCYTGQEVIARMESRSKLSRVLSRLQLSAPAEAPSQLRTEEGRLAGIMTSAVEAPDGSLHAMGLVKTQYAVDGSRFSLEKHDSVYADFGGILGKQPLLQDT